MNIKERSLKIFKILEQIYPDAATMLRYSSDFELLVAVVLSAQSTDEQVNKVTANLFEHYNTAADFAVMKQESLEELIKRVGLYRNKAKNIINLSRILLDEYNGEVPQDFDTLLQLPGVGRKTANVIISVAFNQPGLAVDTHVQRVTNRMGIVKEKDPVRTEMALKAIYPQEKWGKAHHLFIFHGRNICKAKRPNCSICPVESICAKIIL